MCSDFSVRRAERVAGKGWVGGVTALPTWRTPAAQPAAASFAALSARLARLPPHSHSAPVRVALSSHVRCAPFEALAARLAILPVHTRFQHI
eukprot:2997395-Pyramimonas_sp.AAC.1